MKLAHVSDLHLSRSGGPAAEGLSPHDLARAVADDLIAISDGLDLVVVSGDLTDDADPGSFRDFEDLFSRIDLPLFVVPGNHDGPSGMIDYMRAATPLSEWNLSNRVVEIGGLRLLGLNTSVEGLTQGALDDEALALVEREVHRESDLQLVVVMHHPPLTIGLERFDEFCEIEGGSDLLALLAGAKRQTLVLSGHVHRPYSARQGNLSCFVAGCMIAPYDSRLPFGSDPIRPTVLQDFYFIHDIQPGGRHVVTPQRIGGLSGAARRDPA